MNPRRAQEIAESGEMIMVTYQGEPIFIQHVDEKRETARIYPLSNPDAELEVPLYSLNEE